MSTKYQVESGILIPEKRAAKYPFKDLEIGQSFFVPSADAKKSTLYGYSTSKRLNGFKFVIRTVEGGNRVWRTA